MSNMKTMFDLNQIDSQGARVDTINQEPNNAIVNAIEVRNLNFYYGAFQGLKKINLDIEQGKVTAFIGPSGCGKSTLLRTLNRMYDLYPGQKAEGEINFYGENILDSKRDLNLLRSRIGMVFQKPTPFPMSIYENIAFGIKLYENLSKSELDDRVEHALRGAALWTEVKWHIPIFIGAAAIVVAQIASHYSGRTSPQKLRKSFAYLLFAVSLFTLVKTWL